MNIVEIIWIIVILWSVAFTWCKSWRMIKRLKDSMVGPSIFGPIRFTYPLHFWRLSMLYQVIITKGNSTGLSELSSIGSDVRHYAPVKLFYPNPPPGTPGDITFLGVAPVSLSLHFCLAQPYINTLITFFSSAPPLFITHIFPLSPGLPRGMGAEQFDRRITLLSKESTGRKRKTDKETPQLS